MLAANIRTTEGAIVGLNYVQIPGAASYAAAAPDGSLWVLSTAPGGPDKYIWHYSGGSWTNIPGLASRLSVAPNGTLYAINSGGGAYSYSGGTWTGLGGGCSDITAAADGSIYVLSNGNSAGSNQAIWHYSSGWSQVPGAGVKIAASWDNNSYLQPSGTVSAGGLYILNSIGNIYYENPNTTFLELPANASAAAPTTVGGVFVLGYPTNANGNSIYYYDLSTPGWSTQAGSGVSISSGGSKLYVIGASGAIYSSPVTATCTSSTGGPPPASFLAAIEDLGNGHGQVDLFVLSLGSSDTFTAASPATLAVTNSVNEGKPDVDNPRDIIFDSMGDLLIANGGQGGAGGDYGDFACIPAGAIVTGASSTTTSSTNAHDPESIAIGTDSSVALGNVPASAPFNVVEYLLGGSYVAASSTRDIANPANSVGTEAVIALPSLTAGTFAASITNGTSTSRVAIKDPGGNETDITDSTIVDPHGLGWDSTNAELVIATFNAYSSDLVFYALSGSPVKQKSMPIRSDNNGNAFFEGDKLAVSAAGYVAVAGPSNSDGNAQVQVYQNQPGTTLPTALGGPIPFDSYTNNTCAAYAYGSTVVVTTLRWLTPTKLLVGLRANGSGTQGLYTYDVTQLVQTPGLYEYDSQAINCNAIGARTSPKQTGFHATTNPPVSAAYKP